MTINRCDVLQELYPSSDSPYEINIEAYSTEFISPQEIARALNKLEYEAFKARREKEEKNNPKRIKELPIYYDAGMGKFRLKEEGF